MSPCGTLSRVTSEDASTLSKHLQTREAGTFSDDQVCEGDNAANSSTRNANWMDSASQSLIQFKEEKKNLTPGQSRRGH